MTRILSLVKMANGAKDNWTYLSAELPGGVELVDFFHAAQHLKGAFDAAWSLLSNTCRKIVELPENVVPFIR